MMQLLGPPPVAEAQLQSALQTGARWATGVILGVMGGLPGQLLQVALALIACFFLLVDGGHHTALA